MGVCYTLGMKHLIILLFLFFTGCVEVVDKSEYELCANLLEDSVEYNKECLADLRDAEEALQITKTRLTECVNTKGICQSEFCECYCTGLIEEDEE
jgi:hypothetical protein